MLSYKDHFDRLKTAIEGSFSLTNLDSYIERKTYLNDRLFSFKDHEFQRDILKGTAKTELTIKIAQVGLSEVSYRLALAACRVVDDFSIIYTFPNASDAEKMCKTRIDPIIAGSPDLAQAVSKDVNSMEIKQFGRSSFLYMKGTNSEKGAISVPADMIIHDEWDRSDTTTASMYIARLQHKPYKLRRLFSTPTYAKYGILKEAETARRYHHIATCHACSNKWLPSYFTDIKVPGYDGDLKDLNKQNIKNVNWRKAYIACPKCGRDPKLAYERMEWVCENPDDNYEAVARFISPFTVPNILTPSYLVHNSTEYKKYSEFMNQGLGLAAEDSDDNLTQSDVAKAILNADLKSHTLHVFAADMGLMCHIAIGREAATGELIVAHREKVPLALFERRRKELLAEYRCALSVHDCFPYVDMITRITDFDPNAYGAVFATFKSGPVVRVQEQEESPEEGKLNLRQLKIKRNEALDSLMECFKRQEIKIQSQGSEEDEYLENQILSMKRVQKFDQEKELSYVWEKTDENDHFHFALLYLWCGLKVRGLAKGTVSVLSTRPVMGKVRMKNS